MKKHSRNYVERVLELGYAVLGVPGVHHVVVLHDDWCAQLQSAQRPCNCNPDVRLVPRDES